MNVLIACEFSGTMRREFHRRGHWAVSCDILPSEEPWHGFNPWHYQGDIREILERRCRSFYEPLNRIQWDLLIAHPTCTRLCNSGRRWLYEGGRGTVINPVMWDAMLEGVAFYNLLWNADIPRIAVENPVMHDHARRLLGLAKGEVQFVQPWWFGEKAFKATGFRLKNLPRLKPTNKLTPPKPGTDEHKKWSFIHRAAPKDDRWKLRSTTFPGIASACAELWGST